MSLPSLSLLRCLFQSSQRRLILHSTTNPVNRLSSSLSVRTALSVTVENATKASAAVSPGHYFIKIRYGASGAYSFSKGDEFDVTETATTSSDINITLHQVVGGNYGSKQISAQEFDAENSKQGHTSAQENMEPLAINILAQQSQSTTLTTNYTILWKDVAAHKEDIQTNKNSNSIDLIIEENRVYLWPAKLPLDERTCNLVDGAKYSVNMACQFLGLNKPPKDPDRYVMMNNGVWLSGMVINRSVVTAENQTGYIQLFLGIGTTIYFHGDWVELCGVPCKDGKLTISEKGLEFGSGTLLKR